MTQAAFLNVLFCGGVATRRLLRHERLRLCRRHTQIDHAIFARQSVNVVFKMFEPCDEFIALRSRHAPSLMRKVRRNVTIREHQLALRERVGEFALGLESITRIQQRSKMRIDRLKRAKFAVQELPDHRPEPRLVVRKVRRMHRNASRAQSFLKQLKLRALTAAVDSFDCDESARSGCHVGLSVTPAEANPQNGRRR